MITRYMIYIYMYIYISTIFQCNHITSIYYHNWCMVPPILSVHGNQKSSRFCRRFPGLGRHWRTGGHGHRTGPLTPNGLDGLIGHDIQWPINVAWLVVWNINVIFPYIGNNHPNWLSYFSEGFKPPPTSCSWYFIIWLVVLVAMKFIFS